MTELAAWNFSNILKIVVLCIRNNWLNWCVVSYKIRADKHNKIRKIFKLPLDRSRSRLQLATIASVSSLVMSPCLMLTSKQSILNWAESEGKKQAK